MPLKMKSTLEGQTARLVLSGELDGSSAPAVRQMIEDLLSSNPTRLLLAVEKLNYMASAGLRILIFARQKQPNLQIYLIRPQELIIETLKNTGFYDSVYVVDDDEQANQAAGAA
jgi:anti-anti-sigma factor